MLCAFLVFFGSIPFLFGGILHVFFNIHGPYSLFNGAILWFQREGNTFTSAFNNPNYASMWMSMILPFSFAGLLTTHKLNFRKIIFFLITALLIFATILTYSRNGLLSIFITSTSLLNVFSKIFLLPTFLIFIFLVFLVIVFSPNLESIVHKINSKI